MFSWLNLFTVDNSLLVIIIFLLFWFILWLPLAIPLAWRMKWQPFTRLNLKQKLGLLAALYLISPLVIWVSLRWQAMSWRDCGIVGQPYFWLSLLAGLVVGIVGIVVTFMIEGWLGWLQWQQDNWQRLFPATFNLLAAALTIGIVEELIFRGFFLNILQRDYYLWLAAAISSIIFAFLHLVWGEKETPPQLFGLWLMGMVLVLSRWLDGGILGLAWGLHGGWLWGLWSLDAANLVTYTGKGNPWLVGWGNQPLAGLAGIACLVVTAGFLWTFYGIYF